MKLDGLTNGGKLGGWGNWGGGGVAATQKWGGTGDQLPSGGKGQSSITWSH